MLHTVIIDNDLEEQEYLANFLKEHCPAIRLQGIANDIGAGKALITEMTPDVIFLDVALLSENSVDLLDQSSRHQYKLIFTVNPINDQSAPVDIPYRASDFLRKPFSEIDILKCIHKIQKKSNEEALYDRMETLFRETFTKRQSKITIPTSEGLSVISIADIVRLEADRSYCSVIQSDGERLMVSKTLKEISQSLPTEDFFRIHASHLINVNYVKKYIKQDGGGVVMADGTLLPISRRRKQDFFERLSN